MCTCLCINLMHINVNETQRNSSSLCILQRTIKKKTFPPAQCESMSHESAMCKLIKRVLMHRTRPLYRLLLDVVGCFREAPRLHTWTVAALQDDVINGSVTPH